jgi:acyl dehydratase
MTRGLFFEELEQGARFQSPGVTVTEESVIRFALEWDMQPFHVDKEAAKSSIFGSLISSGLQTILLTYRLYFQLGVLDGTALAGLGIDHVRFRHPVRPGDTIRVNAEVTELRPTRQPDRGVIVWNLEAVNQDAEIVLTMTLSALIARRQ